MQNIETKMTQEVLSKVSGGAGEAGYAQKVSVCCPKCYAIFSVNVGDEKAVCPAGHLISLHG